MTKTWISALCLMLAACTSAPPRSNVSFQPDARGLAVVPSGQRIDFGRSPESVFAALDRELGQHSALPVSGCPGGIIDHKRWGDLVLTFTDEQFVGWRKGSLVQGQVCDV